ncbi:hypothetical protein HanRHA438_Chr01g0021171 [Helianthus annuus]|nr:hypothetical protein HanRHA438_Chr01g0021171 [Helianthus annuus]
MGSKTDTLSDKWGTCVFYNDERDNEQHNNKRQQRQQQQDEAEKMDKLVTEGISVEMNVSPSGG